jgi:hypothetical protein
MLKVTIRYRNKVMENRRQFTRILFSINAILEVEQQNYPVTIHDISLNGALVTMPNTVQSLKGKLGLLHFDLANGESIVEMHIAVVHEVNEEVGLQCNAIDIDSVTHLRRLVELNLGDEGQLHKELSQLSRLA